MLRNNALFLEKSYRRIQLYKLWGRINPHCSNLKHSFKKKFGPKMLYFLEEVGKSPQRWRFHPQTPVDLRRLEPLYPRVVNLIQFTCYCLALRRFFDIVKGVYPNF